MTRRSLETTGLGSITALIAIALLMLSPAQPILEPDSPGYLSFDPGRTAGYPAFLYLVGFSRLILAQVVLYAVCAFVLAFTIHRMTGKFILAIAALFALFINPQVASFQYSVLTEGLFLPLTMLFLAAVMVFVYRGTSGMALIAAALAGAAVAVRPLSLPLVGVVLVAILVVAPRRTVRRTVTLLLCAIMVWGGVVAAERLYSHGRHGDRLTSLAGPHVFAKAALIDGVPLDTRGFSPLDRRLAAVMEVEYAPVRQWLRRAEGSVAYPVMLTFYETCIQHNCSRELRSRSATPTAEFDAALLRVGRKRLLQNPLAYAGLAASEYQSLWVLFSRRHPALAPEFDAYIAKAGPLPRATELERTVFEPTAPSRAAGVIRPAFQAIGIVVLGVTIVFGFLVLVRRRTEPALLYAWLCAISIELMSVFIALTGLGEGRYTMGMWPSIVMMMLFVAWVAWVPASRFLIPRVAALVPRRAVEALP